MGNEDLKSKLFACLGTGQVAMLQLIMRDNEAGPVWGHSKPHQWPSRDTSTLPSFLFLPFGMGMSSLCLSHCCILESHNLSSFTDSQLERNFASG